MFDSDNLNIRCFQLAAVFGVCLLSAAHYFQNRRESKSEGSIASCSLPSGNFEIIPHDGRLDAVNTENGITLGVPERCSEGKVILVTHDGRVRDVTTCFGKNKGWFAPSQPYAKDEPRGGGISQ